MVIGEVRQGFLNRGRSRTDIEFDEFCDPNNPRRIKFEDVKAAGVRIAGSIVKTPCLRAHSSEKLGVEVYLKCENLQYTGSFKERGVRNTLMSLSDDQKKIGVIAASFGNHGNAMSHVATTMGLPVIVVMPTYTPTGKTARCERFGAKVLLHGTNLADAKRYAMTVCKERKMTYVNGFDHPNIVEGQGTVGLEVVEQVKDFDAILLPTGGGSLLAGVATAIKYLKPHVEIYGVETDRTNSMAEAFKKNERVFVNIENTIADGLAVNMVGVNTFHTAKSIVDKMIVVKEDWVARAVALINQNERYIIEGAGCVGVAAIMAGLLPHLKGKRVVCVCTGGNIVPSVLSHVLERGMAADGRLLRFKVVITDRPGGLAELCNLLAHMGITLRDLVSEPIYANKTDINSLELKVLAETKSWAHAKEMIELIKKNYKIYQFPQMCENPEKYGTRRGPCLAPNPGCMQKK